MIRIEAAFLRVSPQRGPSVHAHGRSARHPGEAHAHGPAGPMRRQSQNARTPRSKIVRRWSWVPDLQRIASLARALRLVRDDGRSNHAASARGLSAGVMAPEALISANSFSE